MIGCRLSQRGFGRGVELLTRQGGAQVIPGGAVRPSGAELAGDLQGHVEVALLGDLAVEQAEGVDDGEVHLAAAGVDESPAAPLAAEKLAADQVADPPGALESLAAAALLVPEQQPEHGVVVAPGVPRPHAAAVRGLSGQPEGARPGAEVPVLRLQGGELGGEAPEVAAQVALPGEPLDLHRAGQVFSRELPGPGDHVAQRVAVAVPEHVEHRRVGRRRRLHPLLGDVGEVLGGESLEAEGGPGGAGAGGCDGHAVFLWAEKVGFGAADAKG